MTKLTGTQITIMFCAALATLLVSLGKLNVPADLVKEAGGYAMAFVAGWLGLARPGDRRAVPPPAMPAGEAQAMPVIPRAPSVPRIGVNDAATIPAPFDGGPTS